MAFIQYCYKSKFGLSFFPAKDLRVGCVIGQGDRSHVVECIYRATLQEGELPDWAQEYPIQFVDEPPVLTVADDHITLSQLEWATHDNKQKVNRNGS